MVVKFYQAECGDAARIRFQGIDEKTHNIFIDAGFERTFRQILHEEINNIIKCEGGNIDLWIVSHIHDDHIGGIVSYINAIKEQGIPDIVQSWLYNTPRKTVCSKNYSSIVSEAKSIIQSDKLMSYLESCNKHITDVTIEVPQIDLFGLKVTVLSPDFPKLKALRCKYNNSQSPFERIENDSVSIAKSSALYDYNIPIMDFNLNKSDEDLSIENGSCISVLTEFQNKRILWLADAHPSTIVNTLKNLGYSDNNPLECDIVKVSHHGSAGNNSSELFNMIKCQNYLISANGDNRHCLPTKECIANILRNKRREMALHYNIYFTYDNFKLRNIFEVDGKEVFSQLNFSAHYSSNLFLKFEL